MTENLSIRACRLEDIEGILELWRQADATPSVTDNADDLRRPSPTAQRMSSWPRPDDG